MIPIPVNHFSELEARPTASVSWIYQDFYTGSVTSPRPNFNISINGALVVFITGSASQIVSGSLICYKGDNVKIYVSGSGQSGNYTLSTLTVNESGSQIYDVQRTRTNGDLTPSYYDYVYPVNATYTFTANAAPYSITGSSYKGVNPLCCINTTTNGINLFTYVYIDCNGNQQGVTGAGITVCARYGSMLGPSLIGSQCGGAC
jgi:hypothetical protein